MDRFIDQIIRKVVLDIVANLQSSVETGYGTPVDTGWARSNWVPAIGPVRDSPVGSKESVDSAAVKAGTARIATTYTTKQGPVTISNNVPYITILNMGNRSRAPRGFVQNAITKAIKQDLSSAITAGASS